LAFGFTPRDLGPILFVDRERLLSAAWRGAAWQCAAGRSVASFSQASARRLAQVVEGSCSWNPQAIGERGAGSQGDAGHGAAWRRFPGLHHEGLTRVGTSS